ncbi:hypothetical protein [Solemya elarraichensis gill symbiont]|uniref:Uncharacterized protein n=1 Tax=Solemya elarraichensis gill symbiont TaxID=1918949 RepID=A0A1T2LBP7_9GAMM|nr:hypothetical protein [Solemya elarraichensis gill symbiont]OOZ42432.1 hypothetical protein BOW52_03300 [Solemya elarraichensis gill symbiont]
MTKMTPIAQTNLQLYRQLIACQWSEKELNAARVAYEIAMKLFPCRFRGSGKHFVSHLVGTASVLAAVDLPPVLSLQVYCMLRTCRGIFLMEARVLQRVAGSSF